MSEKLLEKASDGANYGFLELKAESRRVAMTSLSSKQIFEVSLDHVAQCVVNNRDDLEIQFQESDMRRDEDCLVQLTFHFPKGLDDGEKEVESGDEEENEEAKDSKAEEFKKLIVDTGAIDSTSGSTLVEFSKEEANFVSPRGRYVVQMMDTSMRLRSGQYDFKVPYNGIKALYLLDKPDGQRYAFVISLDTPIRQGQQKYQHLVWETHGLESSVEVNLSEEDCRSKYDGILEPVMTGPMSTIVAKVFKVLTQNKVFVPKMYESARNTKCVKCSLKANEGFLYPLTKSFVFINKPTLVIGYDDIDSVEFKRDNTSTLRNFEIAVSLKAGNRSTAEGKELVFAAIDKSEYQLLLGFLTSKRLNIITTEEASNHSVLDKLGKKSSAHLDDGDDEPGTEEGSEDDEDYNGSDSSDSDNESDMNSSGSESDAPAKTRKRKSETQKSKKVFKKHK